jgi:FkbM family methyltransferase
MSASNETIGEVIYDFGMNEGLNLNYYLKKGFKVVGVDANPEVCNQVKSKFSDEIKSGRLFIENCILSDSDICEPGTFYLHKEHSVLGQFPVPTREEMESFTPIRVPQRKASDIIKQYGSPHYIKIDLEKYDHLVLRDLANEKIKPPFLSAEAQTVEVFLSLLLMGYEVFNLVDGPSVDINYSKTQINTPQGKIDFSFDTHSAGPFGYDIKSSWLHRNNFLYFLIFNSLGWKDVHATTILQPDKDVKISLSDFVPFRDHVKALIPSLVRAVKFRTKKAFF